jgi:hypothetical protein
MNVYNFDKAFEYAKYVLKNKYNVTPDETTYSSRMGFTIIWDNHELTVYPLFIYDMIIIEFINKNGEKEYHTAYNMDQLHDYLKTIIYSVNPGMVY